VETLCCSTASFAFKSCSNRLIALVGAEEEEPECCGAVTGVLDTYGAEWNVSI